MWGGAEKKRGGDTLREETRNNRWAELTGCVLERGVVLKWAELIL